jgi:phosphohistidine phosphatase
MRLFLLRHGIAEDAGPNLRDFDRALTEKGRSELTWIARGMRRLKITPDAVLSSPLVRARETADLVAPVLGSSVEVVEALASGARFNAFQRVIEAHLASEALMLVGHEPDLSDTAAALIGAHLGAVVLKKAGLIRIDLFGRAEPRAGQLRWLLAPTQLRLIGGALPE